MNKDKQPIQESLVHEEIIRDYHFNKKKASFKRKQFITFSLAIVTGLALIFGVYLLSDISKVTGYNVEGNIYLSDREVLEFFDLDQDTRNIFVFDYILEVEAQDSVLIDSVNFHLDEQGVLHIDVIEKQIVGHRIKEQLELITRDGEIIVADHTLNSIMSMTPLISDFDEIIEVISTDDEGEEQIEYFDTTAYLVSAMEEISPLIIENISEIHQYEYSYDKYGILVIMRDGNYIYTTSSAMEVLNNYVAIASYLPNKKNCIYTDEVTKNAYTSLCPEEQQALEEQEALEAEQGDGENGQESDENE